MATPFTLITVRGQHRCSYCSNQFQYAERVYRQKLGSWPSSAFIYVHEQCLPKLEAHAQRVT